MSKERSSYLKEFLQKQTTQSFLNAVRKFVSIIEDKEIKKKQFLRLAHQSLIELYYFGNLLEEFQKKSKSSICNFEKYINISRPHSNINQFSTLKNNGYYLGMYDHLDEMYKEPVEMSLTDDFSDIYHDLKRELYKMDIINTNESIEHALWQLKFGFYSHWGNHCINAMRALHYFNNEMK